MPSDEYKDFVSYLLAHTEAKDLMFYKIVHDPELATELIDELLEDELVELFGPNYKLSKGDYEVITLKRDSKRGRLNDFAAFIKDKVIIFIEAMSSFSNPTEEVKRFLEYFVETLFGLINDERISIKEVPDLQFEFFMLYTGEKKIKKSYSLSQGSACAFTIKVIDDRNGLAPNKVAGHYFDFCRIHLEKSRGEVPPEIVAENVYKECVDLGILPKFFADRRIIEEMTVDLTPYEPESNEGFLDELKIWIENDMRDEIASTAVIETCKLREDSDDDTIIASLMEVMNLSRDSAQAFFDRYKRKHPATA